jgi:hypothetical protein
VQDVGITRNWKTGRPVRNPKQKPVNNLFLPDLEREVKAIAMRGLSDKDIAQTFGIQYSLFKKWKSHYPNFRDAIDKGRTHADGEVLAALFKRATGKFSVPHTEIIKYKDDYETLEMQKFFPPDTEACKYWLNNRAREHWQQRSAIEASGPGGKPIEVTTNRNDLIDAIVNLVQPKPDGDSDSKGLKLSKSAQVRQKKVSKKA